MSVAPVSWLEPEPEGQHRSSPPTRRSRSSRRASGARDDNGADGGDHPVEATRTTGPERINERGWAQPVDGSTAAAQLAQRLRFAWTAADRPPLGKLGAAVGYSKGTVSKVLAGKAPPNWRLVRGLGEALEVPSAVVLHEWQALWTAAQMYRDAQRSRTSMAVTPAAAHSGQACAECGSWVADSSLHMNWHLRLELGGQAPLATDEQPPELLEFALHEQPSGLSDIT